MLIPITSEQIWMEFLRPLPVWLPSMSPMVVVVPHPDDEILGVGGLIAEQSARGIDISVVAVTDGEHAYPDRPDGGELGRLRCAEQTAALKQVGVPEEKIVRLRLPDSDVSSHMAELVDQLSSLVTAETHIIAPWHGDFHPDHEACGLAAEEVARTLGAELTSYFFWTWHRSAPAFLKDLPLRAFPLSAAACLAKAEALSCHRSQLFRDGGEPILPPPLLAPAQRSFEVFLIS